MADNAAIVSEATTEKFKVAADEATYSGDTSKIQLNRLVHVTGSEGSKTVSELVRLEDAASTSGDPGLPVFAVRQATATDLSAGNTDGDYEPLQVDASGRLHTAVGVLTPGTAAGNLGKAEDAAHSSGDTGVMALTVRSATTPADRSAGNTDGDYEPMQVDANGRLYVNAVMYTAAGAAVATSVAATTDSISAKLATDKIMNDVTALTPKFAVVSRATSGEVIAAVTSKKLRILAGWWMTTTAVTVRWDSHTAGAITGAAACPATGGAVLPFNPVGWFETTAGEALDVTLGSGVQISGSLTYVEV